MWHLHQISFVCARERQTVGASKLGCCAKIKYNSMHAHIHTQYTLLLIHVICEMGTVHGKVMSFYNCHRGVFKNAPCWSRKILCVSRRQIQCRADIQYITYKLTLKIEKKQIVVLKNCFPSKFFKLSSD